MDNSFTLSKIDDIDLKKYNIVLKRYKEKIKLIIEFLLNLDELKKSKIFDPNISKIRFDIAFCNDETIKQINNEYRKKKFCYGCNYFFIVL